MDHITENACLTRNRPNKFPRILLAAIIFHILAAMALMPVAAQPYDLAALTSASQSWLRWGVPLFYHWKFGFDLAALGVGAQGLRYILEQFGMSGAAAIATAWKLPLVLADILVAITLLDLGRRLAVRRPAMLPILWLISPVPLWVSAGHGQIESLTVLSLVLALDLLLRHRPFLAGLAVGLGIGIEYLPAAVVLVVGLWLYLAVIRRRQAWKLMAGIVLGLAVCFGPLLINPTGRASLISGLLSTAIAAGQPRQAHGTIAFGSSLWIILDIAPGKIWIIFSALAAGTLLLFLAHKGRSLDNIIERQRIGMVATGGLILCVVLLDPGVLPQFAELVLGGLCLVALGIEINPFVIILGPVLQLSVEILSVYGGNFQSYWYDMWAKTGISGWSFPQSVLAADWAARLGVVIIIIGLVMAKPAIAQRQDNRANGMELRLSLTIAFLGSAFLMVWSLQPAFWRDVGSHGLQTLPDITSLTADNRGTVSKTGHGVTVIFPRGLMTAANASAVRPTLTLAVRSAPLFEAEVATTAVAANRVRNIVTISDWSNEKSNVRSLWVSALIGRSDWVSDHNRLVGIPRLVVGHEVVRADAATWVTSGWAIVNYSVSTNKVPPSGRLQLSLEEDGHANGSIVWNGSQNQQWTLITMHSIEALVTINGSTARRQVTLPPPNSDGRNTMMVSIQGLPLKQHNAISKVLVGGQKGIVVGATAQWPTSTPLDRTAGRLWLMSFGLIDLLMLAGGSVTLWVYTLRNNRNAHLEQRD